MTNALRLRREQYGAGSSSERVGDRRLLRLDAAAAARARGRQNRLSRCPFVLRSTDFGDRSRGFRLFRDTNPRSGVAWWWNDMGVFATLANVG